MSIPEKLLGLVEDGIVQHGGDLGGWTRLESERLQIFDGRVTLRVEVRDKQSPSDGVIHVHVLMTLHDHDDEILDACLMGIGSDVESAIVDAAKIWLLCVAGPVKSFLDDRPICLTCKSGVKGGDPSAGYIEGDYGLDGLTAYVGPSFARGFGDWDPQPELNETKPWFQFAAAAASPRQVHLAKSLLTCVSGQGWRRDLEIDGHEVSNRDPDWPAGIQARANGYVARFAVFAFAQGSPELVSRRELDRTILYFAEHYSDYESIDELLTDMIQKGFDADVVHDVESLSTIAFGRSLFEHLGVQYSPTVIRARRNGRVEMDVPLMSFSAYSRARGLIEHLRYTMPVERFQQLGFYNAESNAILQAIDAQGDQIDFSSFKMVPSVVPERGVSQETMDQAIEAMHVLMEQSRASQRPIQKKPWWKLW